MIDRSASRKSDAELVAIMDDKFEWTISDRRKRTLARGATLREALCEAAAIAVYGRRRLTITGGLSNAIILYSDQIKSLSERMVNLPTVPVEDENQ
jgi:hypothetical protein